MQVNAIISVSAIKITAQCSTKGLIWVYNISVEYIVTFSHVSLQGSVCLHNVFALCSLMVTCFWVLRISWVCWLKIFILCAPVIYYWVP